MLQYVQFPLKGLSVPLTLTCRLIGVSWCDVSAGPSLVENVQLFSSTVWKYFFMHHFRVLFGCRRFVHLLSFSQTLSLILE